MKRLHDVEGEFHLFGPEQTDRTRSAVSGYRPAHKIHENYLTSGLHEYPLVDEVAPGQVADVYVWFISPEMYPRSLWVGREIDVMEGARIVGKLRITKIVNETLRTDPKSYAPIWVEPADA